MESTLINTLYEFRDDVSYTAEQMVELAEMPKQFIQAFSEVLEVHTSNVASSVPALAASTPVTTIGLASTAPDVAASSTVVVSWNEVVEDMDELVALPESFVNGDVTPVVPLPADASASDVQDVKAAYSVSAVTELASAATAILSDDEQAEKLTPDDIEKLVDDVRTRIQSSIDFLRNRYEPGRELITETADPVGIMWLELVGQMKTIALAVQKLGLLVLARRPPLIRRRVQADSCLRLLAHLWYADHSRATELERLNPHVREPNLITAGTILNAYAK